MGVRGIVLISLVLLALLAGAVASAIVFSVSTESVRDIVIIVYGVMGILFFFFGIVVLLGLYFVVRALSSSVRELLGDPVRGTLEELQGTVRNVRGTTEFMADTAVRPLIRIISVGRGIRRGVRSVTGLRSRSKD